MPELSDQQINDILNGGEKDNDLSFVKKHCQELMAKFDTVQIFATREEHDSRGTVNVNWGKGNFFARYGHVKQWVLKEESQYNVGSGDNA